MQAQLQDNESQISFPMTARDEELEFWATVSEEELEFLLKHVESPSNEKTRGRAYEEVFWGMLNSPEFVLSR